MNMSKKPLMDLTAGDLMSEDVVLIPCEMTLRGAARMLWRTHVSGAPVVDHNGHCVGVLSATDFMHFVERGENAARAQGTELQEFHSASQLVDYDKLPADEVSAYMTTDPVTSGPEARISELAGKMVDAHIHRIVVVDEEQHPIGIVSGTDILAAVAQCDLAMIRS